jgi:phage-related protein
VAGSFRIAEGYVEVTADESGYDAAIARLKAKKTNVKVGVDLDDKDALAKLDNLVKKRTVKITADMDTRTAADDLAALTRRRTVAVGADLDEASALTQLGQLSGDRTVRLFVHVDDAEAIARLDALTRDRMVTVLADADTRTAADDLALLTRRRTVRIDADADTAAAAARLDILTRDRTVTVRASMLGGLGGLGGAGNSANGVGLLSSKLVMLASAAIGALPTIASLGQSLISMGPAAALAAPAVLSLASAFTAVKLGTSGIGDAFKAAFAPATKSASAAATATHQVESAQRSLAKATQAVKDAEVNAAAARVKAARDIRDAQQNLKSTVSDVADSNRRAAESVASAERDLANAQKAARQAQLDLTQARKDAAQELQDLNNRLEDAQLDQRQKVLDLQDAEQELAAVKAKGGAASAEDLAKAQLAYDKAVQALEEQQTETQRLQDQTADANKAGVEGSATVTKAKQNISDANQDVTDKTQALKDAEIESARTQVDGAQKIAKAERDVADARAAAAKAAVDGARQIADAQENAREAAEALADAQTKGATAVNATAVAMAKLAPNAQAFVNAVLAQRDAWRSLKLDVQNTLFAGLGQKFTQLSTAVLPSLHTGLTGTAGVLNSMAKNAADAVINLAKTGTLKKMFTGLNDGLKPLSKVPGQFVKGLVQISVAASPAFKRVTTAAGGFFDGISKKIDTAVKNGHMEKAIDQALDIAKQFGHLIGDIFGTLGNVMKAASAGGGDALGAIGEAFKELRRITALPEVQKALTSIFQAINAIAKLFAGTLGAVIEAILPLLAALAPVVTELATKFGPILADLFQTLGKALGPIIDALLPIISDIGTIIIGLVQAVLPLLKPLGDFVGAIVAALGPVIGAIGSALVPVIAALAQGLAPVVTALVPVVQMFGQMLGQLAPLFPALFQALLPLIPPLTQLAVAIVGLVFQALMPLMPVIVKVAQMLTTVLAGAITTLVPGITMVIDWLTKFTTAVTNVVKWIVGSFQGMYDTLVGHSIIPDLVNAIISWFTSLWTKTKEIFGALKKWVIDTWNSLWNSARSKWDSFWSGLSGALGNAKTSVLNWVSGLKTSLTNTWSSMWTSVRNTLTSTFTTINTKISGFASGMKTAFTNLRNSLGTIWDGVRAKISAPVKFVVGTVYNNGIRKMWNSIAGKVNSKITLPAIGLGFNRGGVVPGTGNSDTVPAMLTPGERILSKQQVTKLGGHRGVDAMLGQDRPTKTGGNPSRQQERTRYQGGTQHFAGGGIVGNVTSAIGGAISGAASWAKDIVIGGLKSAAQKALSSLVRPLINRIPGGNNIGGLMKDTSNKAVDSMLSWFTNEDKKAVGGPAVQKALSWVKTQNGLPYQWAGNGNPSWDCSGLMSAIESVIRGEKPHRRWATGSFVGNNGPAGWVRNLNSPFMIGITNAGVGHTAGTLAGLNVESSGGAGVHMGKSARGYNNSLFTSRWGFAPAAKYDSGGLLQPGATMAVNATRKPERILDPQQSALFEQLVNGGSHGGASSVTIENITISGTFDFATPAARREAANALVTEMKEAIRKSDRSRI